MSIIFILILLSMETMTTIMKRISVLSELDFPLVAVISMALFISILFREITNETQA